MSVYFNSSMQTVSSFFQKTMAPFVSLHHKKIIAIATVAFACLAALYLLKRQRNKKLSIFKQNEIVTSNSIIPLSQQINLSKPSESVMSKPIPKNEIKQPQLDIQTSSNKVEEYQSEIDRLQLEIVDLQTKIDEYQVGEVTVDIFKVPSDDGFLTLEDGSKVKADEYTGELFHKYIISDSILVTEDQNVKCDEANPFVCIVSGKNYVQLPQNATTRIFKTIWEAGKSDTYLKIDYIVLKSHFYKFAISEVDSEIKHKEIQINFLQNTLNNYKKDLNENEE